MYVAVYVCIHYIIIIYVRSLLYICIRVHVYVHMYGTAQRKLDKSMQVMGENFACIPYSYPL